MKIVFQSFIHWIPFFFAKRFQLTKVLWLSWSHCLFKFVPHTVKRIEIWGVWGVISKIIDVIVIQVFFGDFWGCLGSLSCNIMKSSSISILEALCLRFCSKIDLYFLPSRILSIECKFPKPLKPKHPQKFTLPPPPLNTFSF